MKKMNEVKLKPCPFCGREDLRSVWNRDLGAYWVFCVDCRAGGPFSKTELGAEEKWNQRHNMNEHF